MDQDPDFAIPSSSTHRGTELLDVSTAQAQILKNFSPGSYEVVTLREANQRVLAETILAEFDLPLFSNSAMDGFAVRSIDLLDAWKGKPVTLKIIADIPAGHGEMITLGEGETARIMTGAPIPHGADRVVPIENTNLHDWDGDISLPENVIIFRVEDEAYIRPAGQDIRRGEIVLEKGRKLRAQDIALMGMLGLTEVKVHRKPKIAILSSGDELIPPGSALSPGKIYDSNSLMLDCLSKEWGIETFNVGIVPDQEALIKVMLDQAVEASVDLIVSTAGVSVGNYDLLRKVVSQEGNVLFWRVNMRPGKPFLFGKYKGVPYFGLPGNPVSAYVAFLVFVRPVINRLSGLLKIFPERIKVKLAEAVHSDGRESYLRAIIDFDQGGLAHLTGHQGSGNLRSLVQANALLIVPSGVKSLPIGAEVDAWILNGSF